MSSVAELNSVFDQAEELTGTLPTGDDLRNAIHAVITKSITNLYTSKSMWTYVGGSMIINNVDYLARNYETMRTTTQTIG